MGRIFPYHPALKRQSEKLGTLWDQLGSFGTIWDYLGPLGPLGPFETIGTIGTIGAIWDHLGPCGTSGTMGPSIPEATVAVKFKNIFEDLRLFNGFWLPNNFFQSFFFPGNVLK